MKKFSFSVILLLCTISAAHTYAYTGVNFGTDCYLSSFYWQHQLTANGEKFIPDGLSFAHKTLPFGTMIEFTNPLTGQKVIARLNDRGPYIKGRHFDLSRGAAKAIGFSGLGPVCIKKIS